MGDVQVMQGDQQGVSLVVVFDWMGQVLYGLGDGQCTCGKQGVALVGSMTAATYPKATFDVTCVVRGEAHG